METDGDQDQVQLSVDDAHTQMADLLKARLADRTGEFYLKAGRKLARITTG